MMLYNYHTHTKRCNHADGEDREYVEKAIQAGMKTLGFSDHAPYVFPDGYYSTFRMRVDELHDYADSVKRLQKEYANDIRILLGFELEYYPAFFKDTLALLNQVHPDYYLLGQHFVGNEIDTPYAPYIQDEKVFSAYISQVLEGLKTGVFAYLAHPDLAGYHYNDALVAQEYRRLCEGVKALNVPLEINLLGLRTHRHYPDKRLFKIAAEVGNQVVIGADAHSPCEIIQPDIEAQAKQWVDELGLQLIEKPFI